jgi:WD40 repeat protein/DNA-binding SARP family transcriptional activator
MHARISADQGIPIAGGGGYGRRVEFRVLGSIEVFEEGNGSITLGGPKQRAVLAHLLLRANHLVPTDVLIDEVWGEEPPETARNALQSYASHLRKALGPERIEGSRAGYRLRAEPSELDAARFQSLLRDARRLLPIDAQAAVGAFDRALTLWRGPAFADLAAEPSLRAEASRLDEMRLGALEDRIEAQLTIGQHAEVVGELETLTARFPLRERLWEQLMLALYRSGRQAEALGAFGRARELLADELGIDPSTELRKLHERILAQSPELDPGGEPLRGYRLLERLGEDPSGVVYRATQPNVGREVAIRVVHEHRANDPAFIRRFDAEAQAVAMLEHSHVAAVYDYWREPGRAFVVTRFLRGGSLRDLVDRPGSLQPERASRILGQVGSALAAAHRRGVGHGDVRASNVLFDEEGNAYLADFSIGRGTVGAIGDLEAFAALTREMLDERVPMAVGRALHRAKTSKAPDEASALFTEIVAAFGRRSDAPASVAVDTRNPYKGLRPFLESDADDFFGREAFIERLLTRLSHPDHRGRLIAVVGPSGSGKSSVVSAGLVAAIRRGAIPGSEGWFITQMHPGHHPFEELDAALMRVAVSPPAGLLGRLESGPRGLLEVANAIVPRDAELLLVVDQFEEVFTLTESEDDRALLLEGLRVATADPSSRVRVIATLRADFYDRPLRYPRMGPLIGSTTEVLSPLTPEELERAIVRPAELAGLSIDSALVPQIAADVAEQPGALPLVQYALTELYDRRMDGRLTLEAYRDIGGVGGALAASAEHLYATRNANGREAVRQLFLRLVTLSEGAADTRRRVQLTELSALEVDGSAMESAIDSYGRHRLLTFDRDPATREPTVEVAHEALLGAWERLSGWIDEARGDVRMHRRLSEAAREWESSGREPSFLLAGSRLDQFEGWAADTTLALGQEERAYLMASGSRREEERAKETSRREHERALERRSAKRLRALVAIFAVAALVAASLTVVAKNQSDRAERESRIATARELAASAKEVREADSEASLLLALEAVETTYGVDGTALPEAEEALHHAVQAQRLLLTVPGNGVVRWSPNGERILTNSTQPGTAHLYDSETGDVLLTLSGRGDDPLSHINYSPDGRFISTSSRSDASTAIWDARTGEELFRLTARSGNPVCCWAEFAPDGSLLASTVWFEGTWVWDLETHERVNAFHNLCCALAFSPDPTRLWVDRCVVDPLQPDGGPDAFCVKPHGDVFDVSWSQKGSRIATAMDDGTVILWNADTGERLTTLPSEGGAIREAELSPDGRRLAVGFGDGTVSVWELTATGGRQLFTLAGHDAGIGNLKFSPDGSRLASASEDGTVNVWDVTLGGGGEWWSVAGANALAYAPDGVALAMATDRGIRLVDAETGTSIRAIETGHGPAVAAAFDAEGSQIAIVWEDGTLDVRDARSGMSILGLDRPGSFVDVAFTPDGTSVVTRQTWPSGRSAASVWSSTTGKMSHTFANVFEVMALSPDGRFLVAPVLEGLVRSAIDQLMVWDLRTGDVVRQLDHPSWVFAIEFSPEGDRLATAGLDGMVRLWDTATWQRVGSMSRNLGRIWDLSYSPDGAKLYTAAERGIMEWDVETGRVLVQLSSVEAWQGFRMALSPNGTRLAAPTAAGSVSLYALQLEDLLEIARPLVSRTFTDQECRQFLHLERCPSESA